jgi:4-amino-4-deoxy-L-arabinose transferase-like glycosyltransferase
VNGSFELSIPRSERGVSARLTQRGAVGWRVGTVSLAVVAGAAFALRVAVRLWIGEAAYEEGSYRLYLHIARTWLDGDGLCWGAGVSCAQRMPLYPLWLAPFVATGLVYPGVALAQAAVGALTAALAWAIGREVFGSRVGLLASAFTALNPYAVVHDTALQDTSLLNMLVALAVWLLLRLRHTSSINLALGAGLALACAALTSARVALLIPAALAWITIAGGDTRRLRVRHTLLVAATVVLLVGGWMTRNWYKVGAPVLTTESGLSLWLGNNEWTFTYFPRESIDLSHAESVRHLSPAQLEALNKLANDEVGRDRLQASWAVANALEHPGRVVWNAARKIWVVVSGQLSPAKSPGVQLAYASLFVPMHLFAVAGLLRSKHAWSAHALMCAVIVSFALTTAIFWAHTSHKSYLDALLFVYAAGGLVASRGDTL